MMRINHKLIWATTIVVIVLIAVICFAAAKHKASNHNETVDETDIATHKNETDILISEISETNAQIAFPDISLYGYTYADIAEEAHANAKNSFAAFFNQFNDPEMLELLVANHELREIAEGDVIYLGTPVTVFYISKEYEVLFYVYYYPLICQEEVIQWISVTEREEDHHVNLVYHSNPDGNYFLSEFGNLYSNADIGSRNVYIINYFYRGFYGLTENQVIDLSDMSKVTDGEIAEGLNTITESIQASYPNCSFVSIKDIYSPENMHTAVRYYEGLELPEKKEEETEVPAESAYDLIEESFVAEDERYGVLLPDDFCEMYVDYRENETKCVIATVDVNDRDAIQHYKKVAGKYSDTLEFVKGEMPLNYIYKEVIPKIEEFGMEHAEPDSKYGIQIDCFYWEAQKKLEVQITAGNEDSLFDLIKATFEGYVKDYGITIVPLLPPIE